MGDSRQRPRHGILAKQAYEEYGDAVGWVAHTGKPMPSWEKLAPKTKEAWSRVVSFIAEKVT